MIQVDMQGAYASRKSEHLDCLRNGKNVIFLEHTGVLQKTEDIKILCSNLCLCVFSSVFIAIRALLCSCPVNDSHWQSDGTEKGQV